jgi:hypothetical protein
LIWGLILNNPFNIPNIYISFFLPLVIMLIGGIINRNTDQVKLHASDI